MLLGFKPRFKEQIQLGTKVFTMRGKRKNQPKIGETLYMYTGLRTSKCEKISDKEKLISTQKVRVWIYAVTNYLEVKIWVDGKRLTESQLSEFVKYDGFVSVRDFADYWIKSSIGKKPTKKGVYKVGGILTLYHWTDLRIEPEIVPQPVACKTCYKERIGGEVCECGSYQFEIVAL